MTVTDVSWIIAAAGIVVAIAGLLVFRQPLIALRVMLELFTAAGLLRLSVDLSWESIAGVAVLIAVRRLVTRSLAADFAAGFATPFGVRARRPVRP
ncbi:hypothetical protein [Mycolicibacterium lacusdiani]|uniref:hypothetical protein n=1 Tax=Mycolicibacterium lacusdiani TaxID=2895283 RepID=UPI001F392F90|nr:hypothetical protein [Mycolicibacterium lacusdiani]